MFRLVVATFIILFAKSSIAGALEDARPLLKSGKAAQALGILERDLAENSGDVEYNYLLGIAAADAGNYGVAVFAFERVLAINPTHTPARAELAKALIALTEHEAAKVELEQVKLTRPPLEVVQEIDRLLLQLDSRVVGSAPIGGSAWSAYVAGEVGYDTNINTAPNATSVFIPLLGLRGKLSGFATKQDSSILGISGGVAVSREVAKDIFWYANLDARIRAHPDEVGFAVGGLSAGTGIQVFRDADQFSLGLTQFTQYIDQYHNDDQTGVYGSWQRRFSSADTGGMFFQYVNVRHPIAPLLDTNLYLAGGSWSHLFGGIGLPLVTLSAYFGEDREKHRDSTAGRNFWGVRGSGEYSLSSAAKLVGSVSYQDSVYDGRIIWFDEKRVDHRYDFAIGLTYKLDKSWTVTPQFVYTRNDSRIKFNDFDRTQATVTARYDFK